MGVSVALDQSKDLGTKVVEDGKGDLTTVADISIPTPIVTPSTTNSSLPTPDAANQSVQETVVTPDVAPVKEPTAESVSTEVPTEVPTDVSTEVPTDVPTEVPTDVPTEVPTNVPTGDQAILAENKEITNAPVEGTTPEGNVEIKGGASRRKNKSAKKR